MQSRLAPRSMIRGITLVELMVGMTLSLILLAGVLAIFASSRKTYETTDRLSRIQESGRFALESIVHDLRAAGYIGCRSRAPFFSALRTPAATIDKLLWNFERPIEGFESSAAPSTVTGASNAGDILVIRGPRDEFEPLRLTADMTSESDNVQVNAAAASLIDAGDVVQVSDCRGRSIFQVTDSAAGVLQHADVAGTATTPGNAVTNVGFAFVSGAKGEGEVLAMRSVIYFLRDGSTPGAGTSLWRRVSGTTAAEEVVEGIESLQFEFGEDTDGDNTVSVSEYVKADEVGNWANVLSVRIALLARSLSEYGTDQDHGDYMVLDEAIEDPGDRHLRQVFSTTVTVRNAAI